ncbi:MAG: 6-bladed beta-propeller [Bacteroidota bacterium]
MKFKKAFIALLVLFIVEGNCYSQNQTKPVIEKLYINPTYARGGIDTQIFRSVTYIPLETTKESLFGKIFKMEVTDDYYIVSDQSTNSILVFQKNGKFHAKINGGKSTNSQLDPNFTIDRKKKLIITRLSSIDEKLIWFDFNGKMVKQTPLKEIYYSIASLNSSIVFSPFTFLTKKVKKDSINYFIKYLNNSVVDKKLQPFNVSQYAMAPNLWVTEIPRPYNFYYSGIENNLLFVENYNYNIYVLDGSGIKKTYNVVFPQDLSIPTDSLAKRLSMVDKGEYLKENKDKIYTFRGAYIVGDYLCFETIKRDFYTTDRYLLYNLKTRSLISLQKISSSIASSFLPLFSAFGSIVGSDNYYLYSTVSSLDMFQAKEETGKKIFMYMPPLQEYFDKETRKSNPVIVQLKLKENL